MMSNPTTEELIRQIQALNEQGNFEEVINTLSQKTVAQRESAELGAELARAFAGRSEMLLRNDEHGQAVNDLVRSIKLDPGNSKYHFLRAYILGLVKDYDEAIKGFAKAIELNPSSAHYFYCRGMVHNMKKSYEQAIADFDQSLALEPDVADAYIGRAHAWYCKKEYDNSISDLSRSIAINPDIPEAWHNRGSAWYDKQEYDKGIADLSRAILLKPKYPNSYFERGLHYEEKEDYDKAIADYSMAISLDYLWIPPWYHRGDVWKKKKEYLKAIDDYTEVIDLKRKYKGAYRKRAMVWFEMGDYNEAGSDLKKALELHPNDKEARDLLDKVEASLRQSPEYALRQSVRDLAASFIEGIVSDYSRRFPDHNAGFVFDDRVLKWDPVGKCPVRAGITGWLPAFRPDLAKWHKHEEYDFELIEVYSHKDKVFDPADAGIPISEELWEAITGRGNLSEFDEADIGKVWKFEKVAPMLTRIAERLRGGYLDEEIFTYTGPE